MKKLLISVAMIGAMAGSAALAQASTDYPPCTSKDQDHCTVTPGGMHKAKAKHHHAKKAAAPAPAPAPATPPAS